MISPVQLAAANTFFFGPPVTTAAMIRDVRRSEMARGRRAPGRVGWKRLMRERQEVEWSARKR